MGKKKELSESEKMFRENHERWKQNNDFDYIMETREYVRNYYSEADYDRTELLNKLTGIEFSMKWNYQFNFAILTGCAVGFIIWVLTSCYYLVINIMNVDIFDNNLTASLVWSLVTFIIGAGIICLLPVIMGKAISWMRSFLKDTHRDFYTLYILPYEKFIIIDKLRQKENFIVDDFCEMSI